MRFSWEDVAYYAKLIYGPSWKLFSIYQPLAGGVVMCLNGEQEWMVAYAKDPEDYIEFPVEFCTPDQDKSISVFQYWAKILEDPDWRIHAEELLAN